VLTVTRMKSRRRRALVSGMVALATLGAGLVAPTASAAPAACDAGVKFTDPYRVASNNTVRAGFRLTTTCGGKAHIGFWVNGPVDGAWEHFWEFQPGGGGYGVNHVIGKCRPGKYQAFVNVVYAAADGTSMEFKRNSLRITINC
jgi:hypothetical protein